MLTDIYNCLKKEEIKDNTERKEGINEDDEFSNNDLDPLFIDAAKFIIKSNNASISHLQRKYLIGYNRASKIMEQLVEAGIVGAGKGIKPRAILMTEETLEKYLNKNSNQY